MYPGVAHDDGVSIGQWNAVGGVRPVEFGLNLVAPRLHLASGVRAKFTRREAACEIARVREIATRMDDKIEIVHLAARTMCPKKKLGVLDTLFS